MNPTAPVGSKACLFSKGVFSQGCGGLPLWAGWSISAELSCQGGGRLCNPPGPAATADPHGRFALSCAHLGACPFSYPWLNAGIQGSPGKGNAILSLHTQREASMFPAAARREHRLGLCWSHVVGLRLSHTRHTSCTPASPGPLLSPSPHMGPWH